MIITHRAQPAIFYKLIINAGKINNPLDKSGLSQLTAHLLTESTKKNSADEIAETLAEIGASLNVNGNWQRTTLSLNVLSQYAEIGLDIITDAVMFPAFKPEEFKRLKNQFITNSKIDLENNWTLSSAHGNFLLWGPKTPLGFTRSPKSLKKIRIKDVKQFCETNYTPNNATLFVIGNFSKNDMLEKIKRKTSTWQKAPQAVQPKIEMAINRQPQVRVVNKPDMTQTVIYLNQWAIKSNSPDYYQYKLLNYILGGSGFSSRLMTAVRCDGGKTYGIGSRCYLNMDYGFLTIQTSTRNQEFFNTYQIITEELKKIIASGFTEDELAKAKTYMAGAIPLGLESPGAIANKILNGKFNGFTIRDLENEIISYDSVTIEQINAAVKKYLLPANMNLVIVGDIEKIKDQLEKIGPYKQVFYKDELAK
ncbi:MAG: insulinase family protein [Anaerohalosphaeraceae bacterium]|nr:insulinase family protein [Anaerohalosphaeraceae bacterium]